VFPRYKTHPQKKLRVGRPPSLEYEDLLMSATLH
jgi:hypothetical protein